MERVTFFSASRRYCSRGIGAFFWMGRAAHGWKEGREIGREKRGEEGEEKEVEKSPGGVEKCHNRCWSESWRGRRPFPCEGKGKAVLKKAVFKKKILTCCCSSTSEDELSMDDDTAGSGHVDWWFGCLVASAEKERERKWIFCLQDPGLFWAIAHGCAECRPPRATSRCSLALCCPRRSDRRLSVPTPVFVRFFNIFLF